MYDVEARLQLGDANKLDEKDNTAPAKTNQGRALGNVYRHWNIALRLSEADGTEEGMEIRRKKKKGGTMSGRRLNKQAVSRI